MAKKVAIIGAGIAGLTAASYLQRNGYDTEIYELHELPGGLCTSWRRHGYTFDGCIRWLLGSSPTHPLFRTWNEVLDMESVAFVDFDSLFTIEDTEGRCFTLYADADQLGAELERHAPGHGTTIRELVEGIKHSSIDTGGHAEPDAVGAAFAAKWRMVRVRQFAQRLENPFLAFALTSALGNAPLVALAVYLSVFHHRTGGYPVGGSLAFANRIAGRYRDLGGRIHYNSRVTRVRTRHGKACGVELDDGHDVDADVVVSAADGFHTIFELLQGRYLDGNIRAFYSESAPALTPHPSWVQVSLGLKRSFRPEPHSLFFKVRTPLVVDDTSRFEVLNARIYAFDPTVAEPGKTVVISMYETTSYRHWQTLRATDRERYRAEKARIAREYIAHLDDKLGDVASQVEVVDVSTPATAIRYTNNWHGSFMGWGWRTRKPVWTQRELPDLRGFYMTGQWVAPSGGLPAVLLDGKAVASLICEKDGKEFRTSC